MGKKNKTNKNKTKATAESMDVNTRVARAAALFQKGLDFYEGINGETVDYEKAVELWKKAADLGSYEAKYNVGICYERGHGVPRDLKIAASYYQAAANGGNVVARAHVCLVRLACACGFVIVWLCGCVVIHLIFH